MIQDPNDTLTSHPCPASLQSSSTFDGQDPQGITLELADLLGHSGPLLGLQTPAAQQLHRIASRLRAFRGG